MAKIRAAWEFAVLTGKRFWKLFIGGSFAVFALSLVERWIEKSVAWQTYFAVVAICVILALFYQGMDQYRRLQKRLTVRCVDRSEWPFHQFGSTGAGYHFTVENLGEAESLEAVQAQIIAIDPLPVYLPLPVPMKIKHREWGVKQISLSPLWMEQIDLVTGPTEDPRSQQSIAIVFDSDPKEKCAVFPLGSYRITVKVGAKDAPPVVAVFSVWIDKSGALRCVLL